MSLLKTAIEKERWDLAAHIIVLAGVKAVLGGENNGGKSKAARKKKKTGRK